MSNKRSKHAEPALDATDADAVVEAQQAMMEDSGSSAYVGTMSADERGKAATEAEASVNSSEDQYTATRVSPPVLGRDVDADFSDMDLEEGEEIGTPGSRVGFASVTHPRARLASTLHDRLKGAEPSSLSHDELTHLAGKVGMEVDGTGANGSVLKADFVRAMDGLRAEYPRAAS